MIEKLMKIFLLCLILSIAVASSAKENQAITENEKKKTCFQKIGCFSLKWPWNGFWRWWAPRSPSELQIEFNLITKGTPQDKSVRDCKVDLTNAYEPVADSLTALDYSATRPYTIFHFWGCSGSVADTAKMSEKMIKPYFKKLDVNLIFVLWDANILKYHRCVSDTRTVAAVVSVFIETLIRSHGLTPNKIHLVGESVGAHICGYIGKKIPKIYRITALDPAQPAFEGYDSAVRLDHSDAQHVDALHTNAIPFRLFRGFGFVNPIGDVDFYFNDSVHQPGCRFSLVDRCSHVRSNRYWIEALQSDCVMWGVKKPEGIPVKKFVRDAAKLKTHYNPAECETEAMRQNCTPVGWNTFEKDVKGVFHIRTNSKYPFCVREE